MQMAHIKIKVTSVSDKKKEYTYYKINNGKSELFYGSLPLNEVIEINAGTLSKIQDISYDKLGSNGDIIKIEALKQEAEKAKEDNNKLENVIHSLKLENSKLQSKITDLEASIEQLTQPQTANDIGDDVENKQSKKK